MQSGAYDVGLGACDVLITSGRATPERTGFEILVVMTCALNGEKEEA